MSQIFDAIAGVRVYVDDVLIWATTREEHDERLRAVPAAARNAGLIFDTAKCEIGVTTISFLGDIISEEGIRPSPATVSSVIDIPAPTDKLGVQRMLGVVNYFGKVLPALAEKTQLMRLLIKKDSMFEWSENHGKEWTELCKCLSMKPVFAIFDPKKMTPK